VIQYAPAALLLPLVTPHPVQPSGVRIDVPPSSRFARHEHLLRSRRSTRRMDQHSDAPPADTTYSPRLPVNDGKMRCAGRHLFLFGMTASTRIATTICPLAFLSSRRSTSAICCAAGSMQRAICADNNFPQPTPTSRYGPAYFVSSLRCAGPLSLLRHHDISPNLRPSVVRIVIHLPLKFARHESSVHLLQTANAKDGSAFGCTPCRTHISPRLPVNDGTVRCARKRSVSFCSV
jgi:hypothetical protein